jgi:hypothetical protein
MPFAEIFAMQAPSAATTCAGCAKYDCQISSV